VIDNRHLPRLSLRRWYEVIPDVVFRSFTEAQWLERWFCPSPEVTLTVTDLDVRVGGKYRFVYRFPGDRVSVVVGEYRAVARPHQLDFTWTWEAPDPYAGLETIVSVTFREKDGGTELALMHTGFPTEPLMRQHENGWGATLNRLPDILKSADCGVEQGGKR
jgi:glutathione S-transferase